VALKMTGDEMMTRLPGHDLMSIFDVAAVAT